MANPKVKSNTIEFELPTVTLSGAGLSWVSRCIKPFSPGVRGTFKYLERYFDTFYLKVNRVYFVHEAKPLPCAKPQVDEEDAEPAFKVRRYYIHVCPEGTVKEISEKRARSLLRKQVASRRRIVKPAPEPPPPPPPPPLSPPIPPHIVGRLKGCKLHLTSPSGGKLTIALSRESVEMLGGVDAKA